VSKLIPSPARRWLARVRHRLGRSIEFFREETSLRDFTPRGHYHSPLPAIEPGARFAADAMRRDASAGLPALRLHPDAQRELVGRMIELAAEFDWPAASTRERRFNTRQDWYNAADAFVLYAMLRLLHPRRVVEIGSGFSSALLLDAREREPLANLELVFVDPNPQRLLGLLRPGDRESIELIAAPVQDAPARVFASLAAGDILLVDSSHVSRAGSDVNHLLFEILPALPVGVWVHFHDIFWPFEYPPDWIRRGLAWNEAYLVRAFLMYNEDFEVAFWAPYAAAIDEDRVRSKLARFALHAGQSVWIRRVRSTSPPGTSQ
jgi:hypothetical protein